MCVCVCVCNKIKAIHTLSVWLSNRPRTSIISTSSVGNQSQQKPYTMNLPFSVARADNSQTNYQHSISIAQTHSQNGRSSSLNTFQNYTLGFLFSNHQTHAFLSGVSQFSSPIPIQSTKYAPHIYDRDLTHHTSAD